MAEQEERIHQLVGHLFRHESGKMAAVLTRVLGFQHLDTAEDIVQDTLLKALNSWKFQGVPDNPSAWLYSVAKNKAIDVIRKSKRIRDHHTKIALESEWTLSPTVTGFFKDSEIEDSMLRMMFISCHPAIPEESQVALILKTLCGLGVAEIARAFLTNEETITKRIYRAKEKIKEAKLSLDTPLNEVIPSRLDAVLQSLYLLFNEGYNSLHPDTLIRQDLCEEALRLAVLLSRNTISNQPKTNALIALMCFQASRFDTRLDNNGSIILLKDQDRSGWNQKLIQQGQYYLNQSSTGEEISEYHLEAAIASCHSLSDNFQETPWKQIVMLYEKLVQIRLSPILELNKAIAIGYADGPSSGVDALLNLSELKENQYYFTALGDFYTSLGKSENARNSYQHATELTTSKQELELLYGKINALG